MSTTSSTTSGELAGASEKSGFGTRKAFIFAAIGSAVGLGNIWRFPYVAYEGGGGAFLVPYLVALLLAGIPMLFLDYAMGHRYRGSAPLAFRRISKRGEWFGWWQVLITVVIGIYYPAIIAWAIRYTGFSVDKAWGSDPEAFLFGDFLQAAKAPGPTLDVVPGVLIPMVVVWAVTLGVLALGVQAGIGRTATIFIPALVIAFAILVVVALTLPGASVGLNALFSPDWSALAEPGVWVSAFGQIFFSLSVGFGIMITYASYVGRQTDLTGSGAVVAFSNSSFELLAGVGVFAVLGFLASSSGQPVDEVVAQGIGLAFVAFPAILNEAPAGVLLGVLFFGSLVVAGLTSLISIVEVGISAIRDKTGAGRVAATMIIGLPMAVVSCVLLGTTGGLYVLDTVDNFINSFGILLVAALSMLAIGWVWRRLRPLADHMNVHSSIRLGAWWRVLVAALVPLVLVVMLVLELVDNVETPYEGYPSSLLWTFGWGLVIALPVIALLLARLPWQRGIELDDPGSDQLADDHADTTGGAR
ncbi:sodium-dependent transporter [Janibacter melonis]|uniref:sodium-dependent transporter n=1 Tax=Janibacter melonis TaxID=262209 RepID=UPI0020950B48|nr:sodium-dependent transporter [Janibacter melonis]